MSGHLPFPFSQRSFGLPGPLGNGALRAKSGIMRNLQGLNLSAFGSIEPINDRQKASCGHCMDNWFSKFCTSKRIWRQVPLMKYMHLRKYWPTLNNNWEYKGSTHAFFFDSFAHAIPDLCAAQIYLQCNWNSQSVFPIQGSKNHRPRGARVSHTHETSLLKPLAKSIRQFVGQMSKLLRFETTPWVFVDCLGETNIKPANGSPANGSLQLHPPKNRRKLGPFWLYG